jgi:hypothetical protein
MREIDPTTGQVPPRSPETENPAEFTMPDTPDDEYDPETGELYEDSLPDDGYEDGIDADATPDEGPDEDGEEDPAIAALEAQMAQLKANAERKAREKREAAQTPPVDNAAQEQAARETAAAQEARNQATRDAKQQAASQVGSEVAAAARKPRQAPAGGRAPATGGAAAGQAANVPAPRREPAGALATAALPPEVLALYKAKEGAGVNFQGRDLAIPRLYLLQDNSPQVKEGTLAHITGAKPGMLLDNVENRVFGRILFIPLYYTRRFVAWKQRDEKGGGGGLVRPDVPEAELANYEPEGIGRWLYEQPDAKGRGGIDVVEVIDTPEYAVLYSVDVGLSWKPAVISFPSTKAKTAGKISTMVASQVIVLPDGSEIIPPIWSSIFDLWSRREGEGSESYFVFEAAFKDRVSDVSVIRRAERMAGQFSKGEVDIAPPSGA